MKRAEILEYFKDINLVYNDCTSNGVIRHDP